MKFAVLNGLNMKLNYEDQGEEVYKNYTKDDYDDAKDNTAVIHYAGPKPWSRKPISENDKLWWKCASDSLYYKEILNIFGNVLKT